MSIFFRDAHIFLQNVSPRDLVDVVIVAILLYQLLKLIRGTQAVQLLVGLLVIFVVGFVSQALHLRLLVFIFANGSQAIIVTAVILFQPELRRALDQVGRLGHVRGLLGQRGAAEIVRMVDEVINAAGTLSEHRTGALIVFERDTGLENVSSTGVRIDGDVTAELLAALFFPNSPLHDGGVVVRDTRVVAAGCVLPLAETLPGVGRMGTRHRAALGLTQQSDAVVLIVSEETGLISLAHQGRLFRGLDRNKLHDMLLTLLGAEAPAGHTFMPRPFARSGAGVRAAHRR